MIGSLGAIVGRPVVLEELKHKPSRRTLRAAGPKRRAIVKAYRSERAPVVAARVRALAAGPDEPLVPTVLDEDHDARVVVLTEVVGDPLRYALLASNLAECRRAGEALGQWHSFWTGQAPSPLVPHTAVRELDILDRAAERAPARIGARVRREAAGLRTDWPIATVVHRDLYEEQIVLGERVGLIDLDDAALGPAELDLGNLLAHIDLLALRWERDLAPAREAILAGHHGSGYRLDPELLARCRRLSALRLACIHSEDRLL